MTKMEIASNLAALNILLASIDGSIFDANKSNAAFSDMWKHMRQASLEAQLLITQDAMKEISKENMKREGDILENTLHVE